MKAKEIRELPGEELEQRLSQLKEELSRFRFRLATGELDNPHKLRETKRDIARILTIKRERELKPGESSASDKASADKEK